MGSFPPALFIITMCLRKKTCPLPRLFIVREYGGGGGGWIPVGPLKTDLSSIFYGIPFLPALFKMNKSCTAFVLLMFQLVCGSVRTTLCAILGIQPYSPTIVEECVSLQTVGHLRHIGLSANKTNFL